MPTYINKDTGLAEATDAPTAEHEVPLVSPDGKQGSAPMEAVPELLKQGYKQPSQDQLRTMLRETHFNEPMEQAKAFGSAAASGATFGLSKLVEQAAGRSPEDQRTAAETNPGLNMAGEVTGVVGSALTGMGEGAALEKLGALAAGKVAGKSALSRIAAGATRGMVENALFQTGSEASKFIQEDPGQTAQTAIANIGLSALLGGAAMGGLSASKLGMDAAMESKAGQFLSDFKGRISERLSPEAAATEAPTTKAIKDPFTGEIRNVDIGPKRTGTQEVYDPFTKQKTGKSIELAPEVPEVKPLAETPGGKAADYLITKGVGKLTGMATGAVAGATFGHPIIGTMVGERLAGHLDSVLPAILKPIMANMPSGAGLRSAFEYSVNAIKGEQRLNDAVKSIFNAGRMSASEPGVKDLAKLQKYLDTVATNPEAMMQVGQGVGHYMPDHATNLASTAANVSNYLTTLKPQQPQGLPLDPSLPLNKSQRHAYEQALGIAQAPLNLLTKVKNGSITVKETQHMQAMYPALYERTNKKLMEQMLDHKSKGGVIPYKARLGLSVFMGQPLDSSMKQGYIMGNQSTFAPQAMPQQMQGTKSGLGKLSTLPGLAQLPGQSRATFRSTGHR